MTIDEQVLREAAEAALAAVPTDYWEARRAVGPECDSASEWWVVDSDPQLIVGEVGLNNSQVLAEHIAAASPQVVLALLDELAEVRSNLRGALVEALHEAWLAVHIHRFDGDFRERDRPDYAEQVTPDTIYNGTLRAEKRIGEVAERHGVSYAELRGGRRDVG